MTSPPRRRRWPLPVEVYTQPFELALAIALVVNGLRGLIGGLSPSVQTLPAGPLYLYLVVSTLGGLGVIAGLLTLRPNLTRPHRLTGLRIERAALYLVASSYAVLAVIILGVNSWAGFQTALLLILFTAACLLRTIAIRRTAKVVLTQLVNATIEEARRE